MPDKIDDELTRLANSSVARGSLLAFFAISTLALSLGIAGDPVMAAQAAGTLFIAASLVLIIRAAFAFQRRYWDTEVWAMLQPAHRPHASDAQALVGAILKLAYLRFAKMFALMSLLAFVGAALGELAP